MLVARLPFTVELVVHKDAELVERERVNRSMALAVDGAGPAGELQLDNSLAVPVIHIQLARKQAPEILSLLGDLQVVDATSRHVDQI